MTVKRAELTLFDAQEPGLLLSAPGSHPPFKSQLLKWIGNKQKFAHEIIGYFPKDYGTYYEPFLGSGAVLATLAPERAVGSDIFAPLIEIFQTLRSDPDTLTTWYATRWQAGAQEGWETAYERVKAAYNAAPNGADLLYLCRACYGGVVRFRKADGYMSTPCGVHTPIPPDAFAKRVALWRERTAGTVFRHASFEEVLAEARAGDLVYCDPPYSHSQTILYGAQRFSLPQIFQSIAQCKERGVRVALSIDGTKKSGNQLCDLPIPDGLFEREVLVNCGRSMLRRFQMGGETLDGEEVADRLLLTYSPR